MGRYKNKICRTCGTEFETGSNNRHHCSVECRLKEIAKPFEGVEGCWEWDRSRNPQTGYGQLSEWVEGTRKLHTAHVVSYRAHKGPTEGLHVLHTCDNRCCFNPAHLFLGTHADNMQDMINKGRASRVRACGSRHAKARMTEALVAEIRGLPGRNTDLAKQYGLSTSAMHALRKGRTWKHVKD